MRARAVRGCGRNGGRGTVRGEGVGAAGQTAGAAETETGCARIRHSVPDAGGKSAQRDEQRIAEVYTASPLNIKQDCRTAVLFYI